MEARSSVNRLLTGKGYGWRHLQNRRLDASPTPVPSSHGDTWGWGHHAATRGPTLPSFKGAELGSKAFPSSSSRGKPLYSPAAAASYMMRCSKASRHSDWSLGLATGIVGTWLGQYQLTTINSAKWFRTVDKQFQTGPKYQQFPSATSASRTCIKKTWFLAPLR